MAEERAQRPLAAILAADVVGYSRLMGRRAGSLQGAPHVPAATAYYLLREHFKWPRSATASPPA
jgi:hypothetical protein